MEFTSILELAGKTATGLVVPAEVVEGLGAGRKPAVRITIGGYTYRTTVAPRGERYLVPVSAEVRAAAALTAGDQVDVQIEIDDEPREVTVPADLAAALDADPQARQFFDGLSYSNKLRHVLSVDGAKTDETRQRRIAKSVTDLHAGKR